MNVIEQIRDYVRSGSLKDMNFAQGGLYVAEDFALLEPTPEQTKEFASQIERVMRSQCHEFETVEPAVLEASGHTAVVKLINGCWIGLFVDGEEVGAYGLDSARFGD